jgi:hypothetical protein
MTTKDNSPCDCEFFDRGDWVESRLNTDVFGIVVGEGDFGNVYYVQLAGSLEIKAFHGVTLQHMDGELDEGGGLKEPVPENDNVVNFTRAKDLRDAKTKGAA